jgi:hypothetical protein
MNLKSFTIAAEVMGWACCLFLLEGDLLSRLWNPESAWKVWASAAAFVAILLLALTRLHSVIFKD